MTVKEYDKALASPYLYQPSRLCAQWEKEIKQARLEGHDLQIKTESV